MAVVATYKFGNAIVEVDDSCIKYTTPEEIQGVMDRIGQISYQSDLRKFSSPNEKIISVPQMGK